jgi:hypothetical protein
MAIDQIVPIDSADPDFEQWGRNCAVMNYTESQTQVVLDTFYGWGHSYTAEQVDQFWRGYFN